MNKRPRSPKFSSPPRRARRSGRGETGRNGADPRGRQRRRHGGLADREGDGLHGAGNVAHRGQAPPRKELGLDVGIESTRGDFASDVLAYTGGGGADVIVDLIGASVWEPNLRVLAVRGRLVVVGLLGGGTATVDLRTLMNGCRARCRYHLRRPLEEKIAVTRQFARASYRGWSVG